MSEKPAQASIESKALQTIDYRCLDVRLNIWDAPSQTTLYHVEFAVSWMKVLFDSGFVNVISSAGYRLPE